MAVAEKRHKRLGDDGICLTGRTATGRSYPSRAIKRLTNISKEQTDGASWISCGISSPTARPWRICGVFCAAPTFVSRLTNDEVIDLVVSRLVAHELLFRRQPWIEIDHAGGGGSSDGTGSSSSSDLPSVPSPKEAAPESDTFSNNDGKSQAGALAGAAAAGVPFCEECEKAAQAAN